MKSITLATCLLGALAQPLPTWYGLVPLGPGVVQLVQLNDTAVVVKTIGQITLGSGEHAWTDAMRCIRGICLFSTSTADKSQSFVYNVSSSDASVNLVSPCPAVCAHMHVYYATEQAYTLSVDETAGTSTVVEVTGGASVPVADITSLVAGGVTAPGQTTHCSFNQHMYVGVSYAGAGGDKIISIDLNAGKADGVQSLPVPLFSALWATCDGSGVIGGVSFTPGGPGANGTATFGTLDAGNHYKSLGSIPIPPLYTPSGLITATSPASYQDDFIAAFSSQASALGEYLWAVDPYGGGTTDELSPIKFELMAASWDGE